MAVGVVHVPNGALDPVDQPLRELERQDGTLTRREIGNAIEHRVHLGRPAGRFAIVDEASRPCRTID